MVDKSMNVVPNRQEGVVLVVSLVLLVAITLLSLAGISTTTLEFLMASNQQDRVDAFQQAEAGIDATASYGDNFQVRGLVGDSHCTPGFLDTSKYYDASAEVTCNAFDVSIPAAFDLTYSRVDIQRMPPLLQPAPRFIESSAEKLKVASFKIDSRYDARALEEGRAEHNQGVIVTTLTPAEQTVIRGQDIDVN